MCGPTIAIQPTVAIEPSSDQRKPKKKCRVTFGNARTIKVPSIDKYTAQEVDQCWWSPEEHQATLYASRENIFAVRSDEPKLINTLNRSFESSMTLATQLNTRQVETLLQNTKRYTSKLEVWTKRASNCRGLERYISSFQSHYRIAGPRKLRALVVGLSQKGSSEDDLASVYSEGSTAALIFSRLAGAADYAAVYQRKNQRSKGNRGAKVGLRVTCL
jgi:hypothetical protein